jgi:hypothetical protein
MGAEERCRELRTQGAQIDATARAEPPRRRLQTVPEATSAAKKPLGLVWVVTPSYSITMVGLMKALEGKADVIIGWQSLAGSPSCVVLYAGGGMEEDWLEGMGRIRELYPGVPLLVLSSQLDLALASSALKDGADGFVHAMMHPSQVLTQSSGSGPEGRACRPQTAAQILPEPERKPQNRGPLGSSTRDLGDGCGGHEQRPDSRAAVLV